MDVVSVAVARSAGDRRYNKINPAARIDNMSGYLRIIHRCGGTAIGTPAKYQGPMPENTLEGSRAILAAATTKGIPNLLLGPQCRLLADGTIGVMHDPTIDRTTTGTGNVADQNAQSWATLITDAGSFTGAPAWGGLPTPFLDDFLREFGGKVALYVEINTGTAGIGQKTADLIVARGLEPTIIVSSFNAAELAAPKAAGIRTLYLPPDDPAAGSDAASILATNVWPAGTPKYVGVDYSSSDAYIASLVAAGLHVSVYFTTRRYERDRTLALGTLGIISDDVVYQFTDTAPNVGAVDPFSLGVWPHGALVANSTSGRGLLVNGGLQLDDATRAMACCYGTKCPVAAPTAVTLQADITFDSSGGATTSWAQLTICAPDDRRTSLVASSGDGVVDGYAILVRLNGNIECFKNNFVAQTNSRIGSILSTAAISVGQTITLKVQITATQLIVTRVDTADTVTYTDSAYRGGYFFLSKSGGAGTGSLVVTYKNVSVT